MAWYYCDGRSTFGKNETRYIFGSILKQFYEILVKSENLRVEQDLEELYKAGCNTPNSRLATFFLDRIKRFHHCEVYIVIDAIDECPNRPDLCRKILEMASGKFKVLVTSRLERSIAGMFQNQNHLEIAEEFLKSDFAIHIDWMLKNDDKFKILNSNMKEEIKTKLLNQSKGL